MAESQNQSPTIPGALQDLTGTKVGRFAIRARLGSGGMGEVYRAEDTQLKRSVALKRVAPRLRNDQNYRRRLLKEAERASRLSDSHIAQVYDVFEESGEIFVVLEYVEGQTLRQLLGQPVSEERFLELAVQCAEALQTAHEQSIVHCDIKPENIMLTPARRVKILDFGVAKELPVPDKNGTTLTLGSQAGMLSGTPAYMSPEVLLQKEADGRADIFSLGVVFYEALAGRHPFLAESFMATSDRILHETPPSISELNPQVPPELDRVIARMLAKDPAERYATAGDLLQDLREAQPAGTFLAPRPGPLGKRLRRMRRRQAGILGAMVLAILLGLLTVVPAVRQKFEDWLGIVKVPEQKHLAVLPFEPVGGDPEGAAFSDGLTETLTAKLTQLAANRSVQVVPSGEIRAQHVRTAERARQEFGVNLVLEGSLQRSRDMMRVTYTLVDPRTRRPLRAGTVTARASDTFTLQDRVVERVAQSLGLEVGPAELEALESYGTRVEDAFESYLEGRGYLYNFEKPENVENAISAFHRALELDPNYALAYAGLGEAYWIKYETSKGTQWVETARQACGRAVALDAKIAAAHICLGTLMDGTGRYEEAVSEFQQALKNEPTNDSAYRGLASAYESMNNLAEAERTYQHAIELRPSYWVGYNELARFYSRHGRYSEAEKHFRKASQLAPDNASVYKSLGGLYHLMGKEDEAVEVSKKSLSIRPTPDAYTNLGTIYYYQRRYREAVPMMEKAVELGGADFQLWGNLGEAYRQIPELRAKAPGAYAQAARFAEQQLAINPKDAEDRAWLAVYQVKLGNKEAALAEIERARRLAPNNVNVLFRAAQVCELAGDRDRALSALKSAVEAGYSTGEVRTAADLEELRKDPRYRRLISGKFSQ